jgi:hypothetical protein
MIQKFKTYLLQLFCNHNFILDDPDEIFPIPKEREMISFSRWHTCKKCKEKRMIGSGWIT